MRTPSLGIAGRSASAGVVRGAGRTIQYLLRALFATDRAAPLPSSLPIEVGGPLTVVDTGNYLSVTGGELSSSGNVSLFTDPRVVSSSFTRSVGRTLFVRQRLIGSAYTTPGWYTNNAGGSSPVYGLYFANVEATNLRARTGGTSVSFDNYTNTATYDIALVLRSTGCFWFLKGGVYTNWTLVWIDNTGTTTPLYPTLEPTGNTRYDDFRVLDLGLYDARFATDYGLATSRVINAASGATQASTPDAVIDWNTTMSTTANRGIDVRFLDTNNRWLIRIKTDGGMDLQEYVAGGATTRASTATGLFTDTQAVRVVSVCDGSVIKVYANNVLMMTYSSVSTLLNSTLIRAVASGNDSLTSYPRTVTLPQV